MGLFYLHATGSIDLASADSLLLPSPVPVFYSMLPDEIRLESVQCF